MCIDNQMCIGLGKISFYCSNPLIRLKLHEYVKYNTTTLRLLNRYNILP